MHFFGFLCKKHYAESKGKLYERKHGEDNVVTIRKVLEDQNCKLESTVYKDFDAKQLDYPMAAIGEFSVYENEQDKKNFAGWIQYEELYQELLQNEKYQCLTQEIETISRQNKQYSQQARENFQNQIEDEELNCKILQLRIRKKELQERLAGLEQQFHCQCRQSCEERGISLGKKILLYKKELMLSNYQNIRRMFPFLPEESRMPYWMDMPFYVSNMTELQRIAEAGQPIAVEGGPCLFGLQEVYVVITLKDGTVYKYDYNTAHYGPEDTGELGCESMESLMANQPQDVADISFIDQKKGLTRQEYYELLYPFELAKLFQAKLVIPLPDMSYLKYLKSLVANVEPNVAQCAIARFEQVVFRISDMMLAKLEEIAAGYPQVEYQIVHERSRELCQRFYENRKAFMQRSKSKDIIKRLTQNQFRQQSILDYVTMPALPLYLYGIRNVIQIDCINEVDSYRKCNKVHKQGINLFAMLYPEYLSKDGKHTVFYSKLEDKDYIE